MLTLSSHLDESKDSTSGPRAIVQTWPVEPENAGDELALVKTVRFGGGSTIELLRAILAGGKKG